MTEKITVHPIIATVIGAALLSIFGWVLLEIGDTKDDVNSLEGRLRDDISSLESAFRVLETKHELLDSQVVGNKQGGSKGFHRRHYEDLVMPRFGDIDRRLELVEDWQRHHDRWKDEVLKDEQDLLRQREYDDRTK